MKKQLRLSRYNGFKSKVIALFVLSLGIASSSKAQTINSFPHSQNFETFSNCGTGCGASCALSSGWANPTTDDLDWITDASGTGSSPTGPTANGGADHNPGTSGGKYLYVETSCNGTGYPTKTAILETPTIETTAADSNLVFDYWFHMYGTTQGTLSIEIQPIVAGSPGAWTTLQSVGPFNLDLWQNSTVGLGAYAGDTFKIRFRGVSGTNYWSDMAIDDISIYQILPNDAGITSIDAPTSPLTPGVNAVDVTIQNFGGSTLSSALINYTVNGVVQSPVAWTGSLTYGQTTSVTLGSPTFPAGVSSIVAWTTSPNGVTDLQTANDTTEISICSALAGTYTVGGAGADIQDITTLSDLLNSCGIGAPCVFNINPGMYSGQRLIMDHVPGSSATNTITVNGGDAASATIQTSSFSAVYLNGTGNVTIKNLTLMSTATIDAYGVQLRDNANNCLIDSCHIILDASSTSADIVGVSASNTETSSFSEGQNTNYTTVSNCLIEGGEKGIHFEGQNANRTSGNQFINNIIRNVDDYGFYIDDQDSMVIRGNTIDGVTAAGGDGIYCFDIQSYEITSNTALEVPDWGLYIADGNFSADGTPASRGLIANNMISSRTDYAAYFDDFEETDVWHNTFYGEPGMRINDFTGVDIRNNMFVSDNDFAFESDEIITWTALDYNLYYQTSGTNVVDFGPTVYSTLAAWQAGAATLNANSIETDPVFKDGKADLHVLSTLADDKGTTIGSVTVDIDGDARPAGIAVDMGADEFTAPLNEAVFVAYLDPSSGCGDSATHIRVIVKNQGSNTITSLPITINVSGAVTQTINYTYTGPLAFNTQDTILIDSIITYAGGDVNISSYVDLALDEDRTNDSMDLMGLHFTPHIPVGIDGFGCGVDSGYMSAQAEPSAAYEWFAAATGGTVLATGDSFFVPSIAAQSTYYVQYANNQDSLTTTLAAGNGCGAGNMMDITAIGGSRTINRVSFSSGVTAGGAAAYNVYYIANGTYSGNETTAASWTLLATGSVTSNGDGAGILTDIDLSATPLTIPVGATYAFYVQADVNYTNGSFVYSNSDMSIATGVGLCAAFGGVNNPRSFNGRIHYGSVACSNERVAVSITNITPDTANLGNDTFYCEASADITSGLLYPATSYSWSNGDVTDSSTISTSGQYFIDVVDTFNCESSDTVNINFYTPAIVDLGVDDNYCENDSFMLDAGALTSYAWSTGATSQTIHATTSGTYDVQGVDANGCMVNDTIVITEMPLPDVSFTVADTNFTESTMFDASGTALGMGTIATRDWKFGDGSTASGVTAANTYTTPGTYTVTHVVATATGCVDSLVRSVSIVALPEIRFTYGDTCHMSAISFDGSSTTVSTGTVTGYSWDFGDGTTANTVSYIHTFADTGAYDVKLVVTTSTGGKDSLIKTIRIEPTPVADFSFDEVCKGNATSFNNLSTISNGTFTSEWSWGDGFSEVNNDTVVGHTYSNYLITYPAMLEVTSNNGCKSSITKGVDINDIPTAEFSVDNVCKGTNALFVNSSVIGEGTFTGTWDFGDGFVFNAINTNDKEYLYPSTQTYSVTLKNTSDKGCSDSTTHTVTIYENPVAQFTANDVCKGSQVVFTNNSSAGVKAGTISGYTWTLGDGTFSNQPAPSHLYSTATTYNVKMKVMTAFGCSDSIQKSVTINEVPQANFTATGACMGQNAVFLDASSISSGSLKYTWNYGDGSALDSVANVSHMYPLPGTYNVSLRVESDKGCSDSVTKPVEMFRNPEADFTIKSDVCKDENAFFTNTSVVPSGTSSKLYWDFGDGIKDSIVQGVSHAYNDAITYNVRLRVVTGKGCEDMASKTITINPLPAASFTVTNVCEGNPTVFTNSSAIASGTMTPQWTLGDGQYSNALNPSHIYGKALTYNVILKLESDKGCKAEQAKTVTVHPNPVAEFETEDQCNGTAAVFRNLSSIASGTFDRLWTFHDATTDTRFSTDRIYSGPGTYSVKLDVSSSFGCASSVTKNVTIHPTPIADFTVSDVCDDEPVVYQNLSSISSGTFKGSWLLEDGTTSNGGGLTNTYTNPGTYKGTLSIVSDKGCTASVTKSVTVHPNPVALFTTNGDLCLGAQSIFTNNSVISSGTFTNTWDLGNGSSSNAVSPTVTYTADDRYDINLSLVSDQGCTDETSRSVLINPNPIPSFTATNVCQGGNSLFTNTSSIVSGSYTSSWDFGDGGSSTKKSVDYIYNSVGTFNVTLDLLSNKGCTGSVTNSVEVFANPVRISASGGGTYTWTPGFELDDPNAAEPIVRASGDTEFTVEIEDDNGCKDTGSVKVTVLENYVVFPRTVITPNGDGINDKFTFENLDSYPNNSLLIFDRWGREVYQQDAYQQDWEGTKDGSPLPAGTYFYILTFDKNEDAIYKGSVTINKSSN